LCRREKSWGIVVGREFGLSGILSIWTKFVARWHGSGGDMLCMVKVIDMWLMLGRSVWTLVFCLFWLVLEIRS
jgi:hypothetical protein